MWRSLKNTPLGGVTFQAEANFTVTLQKWVRTRYFVVFFLLLLVWFKQNKTFFWDKRWTDREEMPRWDWTRHTNMCDKRKSFGHWENVVGSESDSMQSNFNWLSTHTHLIHPAFYVITIKLGKRRDIPFSILHTQSSKQKSFEGRRSFVSNAKPLFIWQIIAGLAHFPEER